MSESGADARRRIERFHRDLGTRDFFQLLGVDRDADKSKIKASFHLLAKKWHTDAYPGVQLGSTRDKLDEIFKRINEAYETLTDDKLRAEYLVLIDRQSAGLATDVHAVLRAEQLFDQTLLKVKKRDWNGALEDVEEAIKLNPDDPLFQATKGWAFFHLNKKNDKKVKQAILMLKGAIKRQENLPPAYQYLGQLHFSRDEHSEAAKWWRKCLEWEPKNIEAARGLRLISSRKDKKSAGLGGFFAKLFKR